MGNIEDTHPISALAERVWAGPLWHYPHIEQMCKEMRELRAAVRVLGTRIRVGSELHEFMRTEYSQQDKDRKAMNRKRARMKTALFVACDEVDANPIAAAAVKE